MLFGALRGTPGPPLGLRLIANMVQMDHLSTDRQEYLVHAPEGYIRGTSIGTQYGYQERYPRRVSRYLPDVAHGKWGPPRPPLGLRLLCK